MARYKIVNNVRLPFTAEEEAARDAEEKAWEDGKLARKQAQMRELRNEYLAKTDYLALSDVTMSDAQKTWRQTLRDLPANENTLEKVELILKRNDDDGQLQHSVWTIPS
tara:strand:+ start:173 stop:499 length:327 start_codon:yes stop_codon:yes gene_type:complete